MAKKIYSRMLLDKGQLAGGPTTPRWLNTLPDLPRESGTTVFCCEVL